MTSPGARAEEEEEEEEEDEEEARRRRRRVVAVVVAVLDEARSSATSSLACASDRTALPSLAWSSAALRRRLTLSSLRARRRSPGSP